MHTRPVHFLTFHGLNCRAMSQMLNTMTVHILKDAEDDQARINRGHVHYAHAPFLSDNKLKIFRLVVQ